MRIYPVILGLATSLIPHRGVAGGASSADVTILAGILLFYEGAAVDAEDSVNEVPASVSAILEAAVAQAEKPGQ